MRFSGSCFAGSTFWYAVRRGFIIGLLLVGALLLVVQPPALQAQEEPITLKVADSFPPKHYIVRHGTEWWMERVTELTDGQVQFDYYPAEQLGKLRDLLSLTERGVTDIGYIVPAYSKGKLPLSAIETLPGIASSAAVVIDAMWHTIHSTPILQREYLRNGVRPVWFTSTATYNLFTNGIPIRTLEDLQGLKLSSSGGFMGEAVKKLGAQPVTIPSPEKYQAINQGTVDGAVFPITSVESYKLQEVVDQATFGFDLSIGLVGYVINEQVWQDLPVDVKEAFRQAGREVMTKMGIYTDQQVEALKAKFKENDIMTIRELSPEEQKKLKEMLKPLHQEWVKQQESKGLPGQEVLDAYLEAVETYQQVWYR